MVGRVLDMLLLTARGKCECINSLVLVGSGIHKKEHERRQQENDNAIEGLEPRTSPATSHLLKLLCFVGP